MNNTKVGLGGLLAIATLAAALFTNSNALAADVTAKGGAQASRLSSKPWLPMTRLETREDFKSLPDEAQIAMACAKCKSVLVTTKRQIASKPSRGTVDELMSVDECPGCGGKMTVRGDKQTQMVHSCSKCGDASAFCCATKPGAGATKGMEKK